MIHTFTIRFRQLFRNLRCGSLAAGADALPRFIGRCRVLAAVCLLNSLSGWATVQARDAKTTSVPQAINLGLSFLARNAVAWKEEHNCSSCHHAALVVWSMNEAKLHRYAVDEAVLADMTRWLTEAGAGKFNYERPAAAPKALNPKAIYYSLGLNSVPGLNSVQREARSRLLDTVKADQTENGSWSAWPDTRPPILSHSDETMTALACLALLPSANSGDGTARAAVDKAVKWLKATDSDNDPQSVAFRLVLWTRLGRPQTEWAPLARLIQKRQNRNGGWSQTAGGPSDAWATGQALYALSQSGLSVTDPLIQRGRAFLVKTQRKDGSWPMTSRPTKPGGAGSESLIPIIGGGSAWAVLGFASSEKVAAAGVSAAKPSSSR